MEGRKEREAEGSKARGRLVWFSREADVPDPLAFLA